MVLLGGRASPGRADVLHPHILPTRHLLRYAVGAGSSSDIDVWTNVPSRVDLTWYQGDDVTIPLTIEDPADTTPDMSTAWEWAAQIRLLHTYHSTLVNTFSVKDEYFPPDVDTAGFTQVTMFLPRSENVYIGRYRWDLYSLSPLRRRWLPPAARVILPELVAPHRPDPHLALRQGHDPAPCHLHRLLIDDVTVAIDRRRGRRLVSRSRSSSAPTGGCRDGRHHHTHAAAEPIQVTVPVGKHRHPGRQGRSWPAGVTPSGRS